MSNNIETEISNAIGAHGQWKLKLSTAIATKKLDVPSAQIRVDNKCAFGQWLYGPSLPPAERSSDNFKKVKELHAAFHAAAADVADMALAGNSDGAKKAMSTGAFASVSKDLGAAMLDWKRAASQKK